MSGRACRRRSRFYRRKRPDGTTADDVEWSLGQLEDRALPLLSGLDGRWPLSSDDKGTLAQLFACQIVRGPKWHNWHAEFTAEHFEEWRAKAQAAGDGALLVQVENTGQNLASSTMRLDRMLELTPKVASIFGSMHWTLVAFRKPVIAISDQPVVVWPLSAGSRQPEPVPMNSGLLETLEVRVPLSPRLVLLMSWADISDRLSPIVEGSRDLARNINTFTVGEADRQWFHLPGMTPPRAAGGRLAPISPLLIPDYSQPRAHSSTRRAESKTRLQPVLGTSAWAEGFEMTTIP